MYLSSLEVSNFYKIKRKSLQKSVLRAKKNNKIFCTIRNTKIYFISKEGSIGGNSGVITLFWLDDVLLLSTLRGREIISRHKKISLTNNPTPNSELGSPLGGGGVGGVGGGGGGFSGVGGCNVGGGGCGSANFGGRGGDSDTSNPHNPTNHKLLSRPSDNQTPSSDIVLSNSSDRTLVSSLLGGNSTAPNLINNHINNSNNNNINNPKATPITPAPKTPTKEQRLKQAQKLEVLKAYKKIKSKVDINEWVRHSNNTLAFGIKFSRGTLFRWQKDYKSGGLNALLDSRGGKAKPLSDEVTQIITEVLYAQKGSINYANILRFVNHRLGKKALDLGIGDSSFGDCVGDCDCVGVSGVSSVSGCGSAGFGGCDNVSHGGFLGGGVGGVGESGFSGVGGVGGTSNVGNGDFGVGGVGVGGALGVGGGVGGGVGFSGDLGVSNSGQNGGFVGVGGVGGGVGDCDNLGNGNFNPNASTTTDLRSDSPDIFNPAELTNLPNFSPRYNNAIMPQNHGFFENAEFQDLNTDLSQQTNPHAITYPQLKTAVAKILAKNKTLKNLILYGEDGAIGRQMAALGNASATLNAPLELVEIDASPLDAMANLSDLSSLTGISKETLEQHHKRYSLIALKDVFSGAVCVHVGKSENTADVLAATAKFIAKYGTPKTIKGDNGRAFKSREYQAALMNFGIDYIAAPAYSGWAKPHIERAFKTLQHQYISGISGFIGHNVGMRQAIEQFHSKKERRLKRGAKTLEQPQYTKRHLGYIIDQFVAFMNTTELKDKKSPSEILSAYELTAMHPIDIAHKLGEKHLRSVNKKGISFEGEFYYSAEIFSHDQVLVVKDYAHNAQLFVYDISGNYLGTASVLDADTGVDVPTAKLARKLSLNKIKQEKQKIQKAREKNEQMMLELAQAHAPKEFTAKTQEQEKPKQKANKPLSWEEIVLKKA